MSRRVWPYILTQEDAARLLAVLARRGGSLSLRDLYRRHRFFPYVLETAEAAGLVKIETRKPRTGRPSRMVAAAAGSVNKSPPAKLPRRAELPLGLTCREKCFLDRFALRWGSAYFGWGRNGGCATHAYAAALGQSRKTSRASNRSSASRLLRRPWIKAGLLLDRRLMDFGGLIHWPADLRSAAGAWLTLLRKLDSMRQPWPLDVATAIRNAHTLPDAIRSLEAAAAFCPAPSSPV